MAVQTRVLGKQVQPLSFKRLTECTATAKLSRYNVMHAPASKSMVTIGLMVAMQHMLNGASHLLPAINQGSCTQAKMRWLRSSQLWRTIFRKWMSRAREQLQLRREALAVVAMEERRKRYQADAQQRLAWVDEGLAQWLVEDSTCPVCCADAGELFA